MTLEASTDTKVDAKFQVDDSIVNITRNVEELVLQLGSDDKVDRQNLVSKMVALVFQLDDLKIKCAKIISG